ncbi:MAG: CHAD domain-containing protein [Nitrospira sp.]
MLSKTAEKFLTAARPGARRRLLLKVRQTLERGKRESQAELQAMNVLNDSAACLEAAIARMRRWKLTPAHRASISKGLERTYRRGRKAFALACEKPTDENLHEWRKQVKYLGQSLKVWKALRGTDGEGLIERADKLADLLGTDHDLVVFEKRLEMLDAPHPTRPAIALDIADQRRDLVKKALKKGRRIFNAKPRVFTRKIAP